MHTLAQHPEIQDRLRKEVEHLIHPTFEQIESCRYLNNVCREILRYMPPGTSLLGINLSLVSILTRVASITDHFNGITIPKGTMIFVPIVAINCDETIWGPDVDSFNPDRWEKLPDTASNYSYLTFGQGPRTCIGRRFAEIEMKVLLVALIQRLRFDEIVKGRHIAKHTVITTRPKGGMFLKLSAI
jgi:cytochrome P450